jgi:FMN phosphatase YigB (HAD superfamily)
MIRGIRAITFDFGNTLVPFPARDRDSVLAATADAWAPRLATTADRFMAIWYEERTRQFLEDVPEGREANMDLRVARVLSRLDGAESPTAGQRWDDAEIAGRVDLALVDEILDTYASAFVRLTPVPPAIGPLLERLAGRFPLALISNWPLALSLERYLESAGWAASFSATVVSARVGSVKPHPEIFETAARELGIDSGPHILHVGDDPGADVIGAQGVGWRTAWVRLKPEDSPLPVAPLPPDARPDLEIDTVEELETALGLHGDSGAA